MENRDRRQSKRKGGQPVVGSIVDTGYPIWYDNELPIPPDIYPVIDTDLGRDNVENDIPAADLQDL